MNRAQRRTFDKQALAWAAKRQARAVKETGKQLTDEALANEFLLYVNKYATGMEIVKNG